jgi:two-component system response regulator FixJ
VIIDAIDIKTMTSTFPRVHLVDDNALFLTVLTRSLQSVGHEVACFQSAGDCLSSISENTRGCVIVDLRMPGCDGLELQSRLAETENPLPVVFLTGEGDIQSSVMAMRRGAEDFLTKCAPREELLAAVSRALVRDREESGKRERVRELRRLFAKLTRREHGVLALVLRGMLNKQIAAELGTVERTVKLHRTNITRKLEVSSVAELVRLWADLHALGGKDFP